MSVAYKIVNIGQNTIQEYTSLRTTKAALMSSMDMSDRVILSVGKGKVEVLAVVDRGSVLGAQKRFTKQSYKPAKIKAPTVKGICQDIIKQLKDNQLMAKTNTLFGPKIKSAFRNNEEKTVKEVLGNKQCEVCAKGAILIDWMKKYDNTICLFANHFYENVDTWPHQLTELFGRGLLDRIEIAFEGKIFAWGEDSYDESKHYNLLNYVGWYPDGNARLRHIMQDVISGDIS